MLKELKCHRHGRLAVWCSSAMNSADISHLYQLLERPNQIRRAGVVGSVGIEPVELNGIGRVVIKHYLRGGLLRFVLRRTYLYLKSFRSQDEFETLDHVRSLGVLAPEPLAYAVEGKFLYRAWLLMREIQGAVPLSAISVQDEDRAIRLMGPLVEQLSTLIYNRIYHVDLHPGNVVVDGDGRVVLLDFDKACSFQGPLNLLRDKYLRRWRRAVIKHGLPESLSEAFCSKLRKDFESCRPEMEAPSSSF